jgi:hypothetical protein
LTKLILAISKKYSLYASVRPELPRLKSSSFKGISDIKLQPFGIEIYVAIDSYSRYIIWVYIGISARTEV